jgi:hypothetical protein
MLASVGRCSPPGLLAVRTGQYVRLPAPYPVPCWLQRVSLLRWVPLTMAWHTFAGAVHRCLLDGIPGLRLPGSAVDPRFRPLRTSRGPGGYAVAPAPGGRDLHPHGELSSKVSNHLVVCPEAGASFRPTGRTYTGGELRRLAQAHCLDPMICPACKSKSLMIWTTLAPKLTPFGTSGCNANHINARPELRPKAGAQRTLEAVSSRPLFGSYTAVRPYNGYTLPQRLPRLSFRSASCRWCIQIASARGTCRLGHARGARPSALPRRLRRWHPRPASNKMRWNTGCL